MTKIFITGVSGFVGSALTSHLLEQGHEITGLSRRDTSLSHENYKHIRGDLADWKSVADNAGVDYDVLVNLAWQGSGGPDRASIPMQTMNINNTESAVNLTNSIGAKLFVGIGTITEDEVAGVEFNANIGPGYIYGLSKITACGVSKFRAAQLSLEHIWVKLGNTYGLNDETERFLSNTIKKLLKNEPVSLSAGTQNYDFVFLSDATRALEAIIDRGISGKTYYVGSGQPQPLREFVEELHQIVNSQSKLNFGGLETSGISLPLASFSIDDLLMDTDFKPTVTFNDGIHQLMDEILEKRFSN